MMTIRHVLQEKTGSVFTVLPTTTVLEAVKLMTEKNIGALVIANQEGVAGIFSERDLARKVILSGKAAATTPISDVMTANVITVTADQSIDSCMALMTDKRIRHLPVVDGPALVGIISIGDVVKAVIGEKEQLIKQLESYIRG